MQEKKNKRLLILLIVLTGVTVVLLWTGNRRHTFNVDKDEFRRFDVQTIDKVELQSASGKTVLQNLGSRWKVDNAYDADPQMIKVLMATLQQVEPKRPVAANVKDSIASAVAANGTLVTLYSGDNAVSKFYVGSNENKTQTYFRKIDSDETFILNIPGYRVFVAGIFEMEKSGWRGKYVFGFNWRNFKSLEARFREPRHNFKVAMNDSFFGVEGISEVDTTHLNDFLDNVSLLTVDAYLSGSPVLDSISKTAPVVQLEVHDIGNQVYALSVYPAPENKGYYGRINEGDWATFSREKIAPILRPKEFFNKKPR